MAFTPPNNEAQIMTPQQLYSLIAGLIIDNNINAITPYKARVVLYSIVRSFANLNTIPTEGVAPIHFDPFTGQITIDTVSETQPGILTGAMYAALLAASGSTPYNSKVMYLGSPVTVPANFTGIITNLNDIYADVNFSVSGTSLNITAGASSGDMILINGKY